MKLRSHSRSDHHLWQLPSQFLRLLSSLYVPSIYTEGIRKLLDCGLIFCIFPLLTIKNYYVSSEQNPLHSFIKSRLISQ